MIGVGFETRDGDPESLLEIAKVVLEGSNHARNASESDSGDVRHYGREIARLVREDPIIHMPDHVYLLGRVLALLSGLGKTLGVRTNLVQMMLPFMMGRN